MLFWAVLAPLAWTTHVVRILADLSFADIQAQFRPGLVAVAFLAMIGVTIMHINRSELLAAAVRFLRRTAAQSIIIGAALVLLFITGTVLASRPDGRLHLWLLDMGHSHALMVQTPDGAQILVDGGRFPSRLLLALGDRMPFYDRELDMIILTQPDEFDTGALIDVLRRYTAGIVLTNGQPNLSPAQAALETALGGTSVLPVTAGNTVAFSDGVRLQVLNPSITPTLEDSLDDSALVLRLTFDWTSILITSDVSAETQRALVEAGLVDHATAFILPQHGTAGALAAEFLAAVRPQIVLLQSDAANRRGDPHPDTLTMLDAVPLYRTDQSGTIHLSTDGRTIDVTAEN
jgi:beta-lactamase superfamily II metal-dependent hydrolase